MKEVNFCDEDRKDDKIHQLFVGNTKEDTSCAPYQPWVTPCGQGGHVAWHVVGLRNGPGRVGQTESLTCSSCLHAWRLQVVHLLGSFYSDFYSFYSDTYESYSQENNYLIKIHIACFPSHSQKHQQK